MCIIIGIQSAKAADRKQDIKQKIIDYEKDIAILMNSCNPVFIFYCSFLALLASFSFIVKKSISCRCLDITLFINICVGLLKLAVLVFLFYEGDKLIKKLKTKKYCVIGESSSRKSLVRSLTAASVGSAKTKLHNITPSLFAGGILRR